MDLGSAQRSLWCSGSGIDFQPDPQIRSLTKTDPEIDPVAASNVGLEPGLSSDPTVKTSNVISFPIDQGSALDDRNDGDASYGPNKLLQVSLTYSQVLDTEEL